MVKITFNAHECSVVMVSFFQGWTVFPWKSWWSVRFRCLYMCTKCHCI